MERERERDHPTVIRVEPDIQAVPLREDAPDVMQTTQVINPRDRVRWGPIWAGLITALTTFLVLELLMYSLGLLTIDINPGAGNDSGPWVTALVGLLAFFAGGWVAGATSAVRGSSVGLLNGFLVWGLGTVLILAFSSFGLGSLFGALGNVVSRFLMAGNTNFNLPNVDPAEIAGMVRDASWWAFLSLAITALACALGGWAGVKSGPLGRLAPSDSTR